MSTETTNAAPGRVFAYCRVSKESSTTDNQTKEIRSAGFAIEPRRVVAETISGATPAMSRPGFIKLVDRLEHGDVLVVTKLDRLGRNAMDVRATVERLQDAGVRVHCLALGGMDLTSSSGRMTMQVLAAVAEFERDLIIERTQAGLARAASEGKYPGRKWSLSDKQREQVKTRLLAKESVASIARSLNTSRQTIMRVRATMGGPEQERR